MVEEAEARAARPGQAGFWPQVLRQSGLLQGHLQRKQAMLEVQVPDRDMKMQDSRGPFLD